MCKHNPDAPYLFDREKCDGCRADGDALNKAVSEALRDLTAALETCHKALAKVGSGLGEVSIDGTGMAMFMLRRDYSRPTSQE